MAKCLKASKVCFGSWFLPSRWENCRASGIVLWRIFIWRRSRGQVSPSKMTPKNLPLNSRLYFSIALQPHKTVPRPGKQMIVWRTFYINNRTGALTIPIGPRRVSAKQVSHIHEVLHILPLSVKASSSFPGPYILSSKGESKLSLTMVPSLVSVPRAGNYSFTKANKCYSQRRALTGLLTCHTLLPTLWPVG